MFNDELYEGAADIDESEVGDECDEDCSLFSQIYDQPQRSVPTTSAVLNDRVVANGPAQQRAVVDFSDTSGPVNKISNKMEIPNVCTGFKGPEAPRRQVEFPSANQLKLDRILPLEKIEREALAIEAKNAAEFKESWNQSLKDLGLEKSPVGPLMKEIGEQLASGKLDAEKLQKLMKDVKFSEEELRSVKRLLRAFNDDLVEEYGIYLNLNFVGNKGNIGVGSITVAEAGGAHQFNTSMTITNEGEKSFQSKFTAGHAGPIVGELTEAKAVNNLRNHFINGRRNPLP